jgi:membrane protease YdiL (CAAX protease family)
MTTDSLVEGAAERPELIASPWHTAIVLVIGALNAYRGAIHAAQARTGRSSMYVRTMAFECFFLAVVALGVWLRGKSLQSIFGQRWRTLGELFRDAGVGAALWFVALIVVSILSGLGGHHQASDPAIHFLLPQSPAEMSLWVVLSLVAGIGEEAIFRGYLQRQFMAFCHSVPAGIVLSAAAFGAAHLYQGWSRALVIAASAVLFGVVAQWRETVRPGMFAHAFQDAIAPLLIKLMHH